MAKSYIPYRGDLWPEVTIFNQQNSWSELPQKFGHLDDPDFPEQ